MTGLDNMIYMQATSDAPAPDGDPHLRPRHRPRPGLGQGPEQTAARPAHAARGGAERGLTVSKSTRNFLMIVCLTSRFELDQLRPQRLPRLQRRERARPRARGGEVQSFGTGYAMRIWLDTDKLTKYGMTISDVVAGVRAYNAEVSAGSSAAPRRAGPAAERLDPGAIAAHDSRGVRRGPAAHQPDGSCVRVFDVGRVELARSSTTSPQLPGPAGDRGWPSARPRAPTLSRARRRQAKMQELSRYFPEGCRSSTLRHHTLRARRHLGSGQDPARGDPPRLPGMYLFLGNLRATLVPTIAVPWCCSAPSGCSAVRILDQHADHVRDVLSIGLLVDDAIVVVENVERLMSEEDCRAEATAKSMDEIQSALVGIGLVLAAVFGPMAFFPGSTGIIYRQFAITVIASMVLSVFVALILSPVLCASLLKPVPRATRRPRPGRGPCGPSAVVRPALLPAARRLRAGGRHVLAAACAT